MSRTRSSEYILQKVLENRVFLMEYYKYWATKQIVLLYYLFFSPKTSGVGTKMMIP